jgi:hypothetical protein
MKAWRVDRRVNNVKNNEPSLCDPLRKIPLPRSPHALKSPDANRKQMRAGSWECFDFFRSNGLQAMVQKSRVGFIETMDCLPVSKLPEGREWTYELKLDGYRLEAVRGEKEVTLYSRRRKVLNGRFGYIAKALEHLPAGTVVDGEIVALGPNGHADFYLLQKFRSAESQIVYYVFDILVHEKRDLIRLPLSERRRILGEVVKPNQHVALSAVSDRSAAEMLKFAKTHGVEGLIPSPVSSNPRACAIGIPGRVGGIFSSEL